MTLARLLWGTVIHRPYVYAFFACFLFFAVRRLGAGRTALYIVCSYGIAWASEYSATRNGFPFGMYVYFDETRTRELWISNIPFWDSLSFVFLSYFSWMTASWARDPGRPEARMFELTTAALAGVLMMLLDLVIDPLTLLGDRWFLGKIYYYPQGGAYFGVTLANFAGWVFVGSFTVGVSQWLLRRPGSGESVGARPHAVDRLGPLGVYLGVFAFNLGITAWIGEWNLFLASSLIVVGTLAFLMALAIGPACGPARVALRRAVGWVA